MAKAYWVSWYRSISNPEAVAEYAKLAGLAILAAGGKFLARGNADAAYEAGLKQRIVIVEFPSVEAAVACHDGPGLPGRAQGVQQGRRARLPHRRGARVAAL